MTILWVWAFTHLSFHKHKTQKLFMLLIYKQATDERCKKNTSNSMGKQAYFSYPTGKT